MRARQAELGFHLLLRHLMFASSTDLLPFRMFLFSIDHFHESFFLSKLFFTFACLHMTWSVLLNGYMFILWPKNSLSAMKTKLLDTFPTSRADRIKLKGIAVSTKVALTSRRWLKSPSEWITKQKFNRNTPNVKTSLFAVLDQPHFLVALLSCETHNNASVYSLHTFSMHKLTFSIWILLQYPHRC